MKKTLTENISRYDDKMRLRLNKKTVLAVIVSLIPAALIGWLFCMISIMLGVPIALALFLSLMLLQLGIVDGMPLSTYAKEALRQFGRRKLYYLCTDTNRVSFQQLEEGSEIHAKKKKQKQKRRRGK